MNDIWYINDSFEIVADDQNSQPSLLSIVGYIGNVLTNLPFVRAETYLSAVDCMYASFWEWLVQLSSIFFGGEQNLVKVSRNKRIKYRL